MSTDGRWYTLGGADGHTPVKVTDVRELARLTDEQRRVALTVYGDPQDDEATCVSTVFLGLDHQWGQGPPLLFETMVFSDDEGLDDYQDRCSTWEQALLMHAHTVAAVNDRRRQMGLAALADARNGEE